MIINMINLSSMNHLIQLRTIPITNKDNRHQFDELFYSRINSMAKNKSANCYKKPQRLELWAYMANAGDVLL